jgi:ABC-2 type transport system permease protein
MEAKKGSLLADWRVLCGYLTVNLQSAMEYRGSFISQVVFMFLNDVLLLFFWWVLFSQIPSVSDWQMQDVLLLYAIGTSTFAFQAILFGHSFSLARTIATGGLDYYLTLPKNPFWHLLISQSSSSAWGDLLFGIVTFVWATGGSLVQLALYPFYVVAGGIVATACGALTGSLAFYWGNSDGFAAQYNNAMISFTLYPESIFSPSMRLLLYTLVPVGFVTYLPVRLVQHFTVGCALILVTGAVLSMLCAALVFRHGLRRYESGNLVVTRI